MVAVPVAIPVTTPVLLSIVATEILLLLHTPPGVASVSVVVEPAQRDSVPDIPATGLMTVIMVVATAVPQLPVTVYETVTEPAATPVIMPAVTVATDVLLLLHAPPVIASVRVIVEPILTDEGPDKTPADGVLLTVITLVVVAVPQLLVTV